MQQGAFSKESTLLHQNGIKSEQVVSCNKVFIYIYCIKMHINSIRVLIWYTY